MEKRMMTPITDRKTIAEIPNVTGANAKAQKPVIAIRNGRIAQRIGLDKALI